MFSICMLCLLCVCVCAFFEGSLDRGVLNTQSPKSKEGAKESKEADEAAKDGQDPPPPDSQPPPLPDALVSATLLPTMGDAAMVTAVPVLEGVGGIKADARPLGSGEKRSLSMAVKNEFVNPEEAGYVHKFRWGAFVCRCVGVGVGAGVSESARGGRGRGAPGPMPAITPDSEDDGLEVGGCGEERRCKGDGVRRSRGDGEKRWR